MKKRSLFVAFALVILFIVSSPCAAQATFSTGTLITEALDFVAKCADLDEVAFDQGANITGLKLQQAVTIDACESWSDALPGAKKILEGLGLTPYIERGLLRVKLVTARTASRVPREKEVRTTTPNERDDVNEYDRLDSLVRAYNRVYRRALPVAQHASPRVRSLYEDQAGSYTRGESGYSRGYAYRSNGYSFLPDPYLVEFFSRHTNRQLYGVIKIDGPDRQHRNVRIKINGDDKGVASKYDQKVNGVIIVRVRDNLCDPQDGQPCEVKTQQVEFIKEEDRRIRRFTRFPSVEPFEVTGYENMLWLRVDDKLFDNAEIRDRLKAQSLPEIHEEGVVKSQKEEPSPKP